MYHSFVHIYISAVIPVEFDLHQLVVCDVVLVSVG